MVLVIVYVECRVIVCGVILIVLGIMYGAITSPTMMPTIKAITIGDNLMIVLTV